MFQTLDNPDVKNRRYRLGAGALGSLSPPERSAIPLIARWTGVIAAAPGYCGKHRPGEIGSSLHRPLLVDGKQGAGTEDRLEVNTYTPL